jgi:hypothetical protein
VETRYADNALLPTAARTPPYSPVHSGEAFLPIVEECYPPLKRHTILADLPKVFNDKSYRSMISTPIEIKQEIENRSTSMTQILRSKLTVNDR